MDALSRMLGLKGQQPSRFDSFEGSVFDQPPPAPLSGPQPPLEPVPQLESSKELEAASGSLFQHDSLKAAAEYAKTLDASPHSKDIMDALKRDLANKLQQNKAVEQQFRIQQEQEKTRRMHEEAEEQGKLMQRKTEENRKMAQYNDQLARKREEDLANAEIMKNQKVEEEKRRTNEQHIQQKIAMNKQRAEDEAEAKAKAQRLNHDLELEMIREKGKEERKTRMEQHMESVKTAKEVLMSFGSSMMEPKNMRLAVGGAAATFTAYFFVKGSSGVIFRIISDHLRKPDVVMETSRIMPLSVLKHPIKTAKIVRWRFNKEDPKAAFQTVILAPQIEKKILDIALLAKNSRQMKLPYNNLLLHGPPGTGKTMFAQLLAKNSGMDYAIVSGGHMNQLGDKGVQEVDKLFSWAATSRNGIILFMDEAESFLARRYGGNTDSDTLATLSAFLAHTGKPNDKFMMVLTSNLPTVFDAAVLSRVQDSLEFPAPAAPERHRLMLQYFLQFVVQPAAQTNSRIKLSAELMEAETQRAILKEIADMTEGMVGRDIATLCRGFQRAAHLDSEGCLSKSMMMELAQDALHWSKERHMWRDVPLASASMSRTVVAASRE